MKRKLTILSLGLAAMLAFGALSAASASASAPEFVPEGGEEAFPIDFTSEVEAELKLETVGGRVVVCTKAENEGEITGPDTIAEVIVTFQGCKATIGKAAVECHTELEEGEEDGKIVTNKLEGKLRYIEVEDPEDGEGEFREAVGTATEPEEGELFATFVCDEGGTSQTLKVRGSVVGELTPVNQMVEESELHYRQSGGEQNPKGYLSKAACEFVSDFLETKGEESKGAAEDFAFEESGIESSEPVKLKTPGEKVEIKATQCE